MRSARPQGLHEEEHVDIAVRLTVSGTLEHEQVQNVDAVGEVVLLRLEIGLV